MIVYVPRQSAFLLERVCVCGQKLEPNRATRLTLKTWKASNWMFLLLSLSKVMMSFRLDSLAI